MDDQSKDYKKKKEEFFNVFGKCHVPWAGSGWMSESDFYDYLKRQELQLNVEDASEELQRLVQMKWNLMAWQERMKGVKTHPERRPPIGTIQTMTNRAKDMVHNFILKHIPNFGAKFQQARKKHLSYRGMRTSYIAINIVVTMTVKKIDGQYEIGIADKVSEDNVYLQLLIDAEAQYLTYGTAWMAPDPKRLTVEQMDDMYQHVFRYAEEMNQKSQSLSAEARAKVSRRNGQEPPAPRSQATTQASIESFTSGRSTGKQQTEPQNKNIGQGNWQRLPPAAEGGSSSKLPAAREGRTSSRRDTTYYPPDDQGKRDISEDSSASDDSEDNDNPAISTISARNVVRKSLAKKAKPANQEEPSPLREAVLNPEQAERERREQVLMVARGEAQDDAGYSVGGGATDLCEAVQPREDSGSQKPPRSMTPPGHGLNIFNDSLDNPGPMQDPNAVAPAVAPVMDMAAVVAASERNEELNRGPFYGVPVNFTLRM
jgi:hypothetical protein